MFIFGVTIVLYLVKILSGLRNNSYSYRIILYSCIFGFFVSDGFESFSIACFSDDDVPKLSLPSEANRFPSSLTFS